MRIKDISLENRPRERLEKYGALVLSDAELLALVLQKGIKNENVINMSNRLISRYGLDKLSGCSLKELQEIKGIGKAKAMQIIALFELNKRLIIAKQNGRQIKSAKDVFDYCYPKIGRSDRELFIVLYLDTKNRIIKDETVSVGTLNSSLIHPREVFKSAIKESANSLIFVHNHPSGDAAPSSEDREITKVLFDSGSILNIKVLDHIIIGNNDYFSFNEQNKI